MLTVWRRSPFIRLFLPYATGVIAQCSIHLSMFSLLMLSCLMLPIIFIMLEFKDVIRHAHRHMTGWIISLAMFLLAMLLTELRDDRYMPNHFSGQNGGGEWMVRITTTPKLKEKSVKMMGEVLQLRDSLSTKESQGQVLIYLKRDSLSETLKPDDIVFFRGTLNEVSPPANPYEFDYRAYLERHNVYAQIYADSSKWRLDNTERSTTFMGRILNWREQMLTTLRSYGVEGEEYAVLAALVLGKTDDIDSDLMAAYSGAGAVHVLAVSGLHVGLIYAILNGLFAKFARLKKKTLLKGIISATLLWLFAAITGFSPSVLRAAVMFSCFIVAEMVGRNHNIYNTLFCSAFLLMVYDPMMLFEVGFQLSYIAVLGILLWQKGIEKMLFFKNKWAMSAWKLTAVSIAAQLAAFPICLFYFHQFPTYFLIANFIVIPLSTVILYAGLLFYAVVWWSTLAQVVANFCALLTHWMNACIRLFDDLPMSVLDQLGITGLQCVMLYILVCAFVYTLLWRSPKALLITLISACVFLIFLDTQKWMTNDRSVLCIHSSKSGLVFSYATKADAYLLSESAILESGRLDFQMKGYLDELGISAWKPIAMDSLSYYNDGQISWSRGALTTRNGRIRILEESDFERGFSDALVVLDDRWNKHYWKAEELVQLQGKQIVLGQKMREGKKQYLKEQLAGERVYDLSNGALVVVGDSVVSFRNF